jgi:hypothetical protein
MDRLSFYKIAVMAAHALALWVLCGALMFAGMSLMPLEYALVIHAIGAPVIAALVSWFYFKRFHYTTAPFTAFFFVTIVILMDFFVVALLIERSFVMFTSVLGTWLPFVLIFIATYLTGRYVTARLGMAKAAWRL